MKTREHNGVSLSSSEWRELEKLAGSDSPKAEASRSLSEDAMTDVYRSLLDKGMVSGSKTWGGFVFSGVTFAGADFVKDCIESERDAARAEKSSRRHDYKVAAFGFVGGAVFGAVVTFLTGLFAGLFTR